MSLVKLKIIYDYYATKRVTPIFIMEEELMDFTFEEFKVRLTTEVPHLDKMGSSLRLSVLEDNVEVDLSTSYFNFQIKDLLEKEKAITVKAFSFDSPSSHLTTTRNTKADKDPETSSVSENQASTRCNQSAIRSVLSQPRAKRSIFLPESQNERHESLFSPDSDEEDNDREQPKSRIMLPLERYAQRKQQAADDIRRKLQSKKQELFDFECKLSLASQQNTVNAKAGSICCGKCHMKLGHTKKRCEYSPCKSAYSCGNISKHASEKIKMSTLQREISKLEQNLSAAENEIHNAESATEKVMTSVPKQIEDVIVDQLPDRYMSFGRRNWMLLNKDVATLQKHLRGKLPSKDNVLQLLHSVVLNSSTSITEHRVSSQKRLLSEKYGIVFPTDKQSGKTSHSRIGSTITSLEKQTNTSSTFSSSKVNVFTTAQEENDFKLALELQHEEMGSPPIADCFNQASDTDMSETADPNVEFEANAAAALLQLQRQRLSK